MHNCVTLNASTCAIISQNGQYAVVDAAGMVSGNGQNIIVYFSCLKDMHDFIYNLAALIGGGGVFEITGVSLIHIDSNESSQAKSLCPKVKCTDYFNTNDMSMVSSLVCSIASTTNR